MVLFGGKSVTVLFVSSEMCHQFSLLKQICSEGNKVRHKSSEQSETNRNHNILDLFVLQTEIVPNKESWTADII